MVLATRPPRQPCRNLHRIHKGVAAGGLLALGRLFVRDGRAGDRDDRLLWRGRAGAWSWHHATEHSIPARTVTGPVSSSVRTDPLGRET